MKKTVALVLSVMMVLALLAGCADDTAANNPSNPSSNGTGNTEGTVIQAPDTTTQSDADVAHSNENEITDLVYWATGDFDTFNTFNTENQQEAALGMLYDCWLGKDKDGNITNLLADSYSANEDSSVWTFHLRGGATWVDNQLNYKADVSVYDFLTSAEWILNYHKNAGNNSSMLITNIVGASEYYDYTKNLSSEEAMALTYKDVFSEMVGIVADEAAGTVTYNCIQPTPYFWSIATHKSTGPLSQALVDELGAENYNAISYDQLWSCGGYVLTEYIGNNSKTFTANTTYWNYDNTKLFDTVTIKIIESSDTGYQLFLNGEIDQITVGESTLVSILGDPEHQFHDYVTKQYGTVSTYVFYFNYDKVDPNTDEPDTNWNKAIDNENFRMAMYWGLDLEGLYSRVDPVTPYSVAGFTFTQNGLVNVEGMDYQDYVISLLGLEKSNDYDSRYDKERAQQYLDTAIEEMTAAGVTFPITINYYIASGNQTSLDTATVLKAAFEDFFGEYIDFQINTYVSSYMKEVVAPKYQSLIGFAWTADYDDPSNCIEQASLTSSENAFIQFMHCDELTEGQTYEYFQEFTNMCFAAREITGDLEARYKAYAEAEAFMISHNLAMPMYTTVKWQLTRVNDYSKSLRGQSYQNWETNSEVYSTADYNTFAAEKAAK